MLQEQCGSPSWKVRIRVGTEHGRQQVPGRALVSVRRGQPAGGGPASGSSVCSVEGSHHWGLKTEVTARPIPHMLETESSKLFFLSLSPRQTCIVIQLICIFIPFSSVRYIPFSTSPDQGTFLLSPEVQHCVPSSTPPFSPHMSQPKTLLALPTQPQHYLSFPKAQGVFLTRKLDEQQHNTVSINSPLFYSQGCRRDYTG